ncbi:bromodomain-containing protein 8 [Zootermopsis nevadensis]|uniref:bromodomain-containing protein 8 n=1 Tax=Zootermopsis nevadensis TaxID=136037 RepID=UPI000B8E6860|nr:bromodomain-containing protein 8 [Zootermopsis nevadensis]
MNSVQERLKLKRIPIDTWSIKEKLCLASAVLRSGDQNWMSVSRALRLFGEPGRPVDWFSQKSCALQYGNLLENVDTPKRKKRTDKSGSEHVETPGEAIVRNLTHERISELKRLLQEERAMYLKMKEEVAQIKAGQVDDKLGEMCQQIEVEEKQKDRDAEAHKQWLQERQEKKIELERAWKPPVTAASPHRKKIQRGPGGSRRNSSQSEPSSEADSVVDSPLSEPLNVDVIGDETSEVLAEVKPVVPTPTSPLLTSLLKSPSPAPSSQSSILHSAITAHHRGVSSNPTITSLLHSSPGIPAPGVSSVAPPPVTVSSSLKNLVTSAIGTAGGEDMPKPSSTSPAAGAPTLSMLLELPPSLPGKPLPELPVSSVAKLPNQHLHPSTNKAEEVCHPQHQEMRVRREVGTDEPVEVVEVEQNSDAVTIPNLRDQVVGMEVVVGPQDIRPVDLPHGPSQKLIDEELEVVSQAIADVEKMEQEEHASRKALLEAESLSDSKEADDKREVAEDMLENVHMLMEMPVVVADSGPEPETVAEVIEVPALGSRTSDAEIVIVDGSMLVGQEEVPPDTQCQVVEVVLTGKNGDGSKQDVISEGTEPDVHQEAFEDGNEKDVSLPDKTVTVQDKHWDSIRENKEDDSVEKTSTDVAGENETLIGEAVINKDFELDEGSRIEVVAIEIPTSKAEEMEINKANAEEDLNKEKVQSVKEDEDEMVVKEKKQDAPTVEATECDKVDSGNETGLEVTHAATKESYSSEETHEQDIDSCKIKKELITSDVEKEVKKESLGGEVEENGRAERDVADAVEKEDLPAPEPPGGNVEGVKKESMKQEVETEDLMTETYEVTEKISEAAEEDDSHAESSEDEKKAGEKPWTAAEHAEEPISENTSVLHSSTGGKTWKEDDEEEYEDEDKKEKGGGDELKQAPDNTATQKVAARADTPSTEDDKTNDAVEPPRNNRRRGIIVTPIDSVPNSPAAPITDEDREYRAWKKSIMLLYGRLATHKYASLFLRPITDDQAPGYSGIVHRPIDLSTIKKNIELGVTRTTAEFQRDVMLMFLNSIMYNKTSHFVHKMARQMQQEGMQHVQDFLTTQMLVQVVGEAPLRRETRTTEANKQRDFLSTPGGSSSQDETDGPPSQNSKRKRPEQDRGSAKKRKLGADE